jgi:hypothetical protein
METNEYAKLLETFRLVYYDGFYGSEQGQRTIDRKIKMLQLDIAKCQAEIDKLLQAFEEYKEAVMDFLSVGDLAKNQQVELAELQGFLELTDEDC